MNLPVVSIIIPFYNAEQTLQRSIDSALNQTYPYIEIILVDNNSTDQSAKIAAQNVLLHPGTIRLLKEIKPGSNFARNTGLRSASGEWLQFLDADDVISEQKISHQMELVKLHTQIDVIYAPYTEILPQTEKGEVRIYSKRSVSDDLINGFINSTLGCTISNLWKRSTLQSANGWDEDKSSSQEYFLMLKLWKAERNFLLDTLDFTRAYREPDSISRPRSDAAMLKLHENRLDYLADLTAVLKYKNIMTPEINSRINTQMVQNIHVNFFHAYTLRKEIAKIAKRFGLQIDFRNKLKFYPHYIYSKYAFNKPYKYLRFAYYSFINLNKLF